MKFRWTVAPSQPLLTGQLANALKISPLLTQCLVNRGFSEHERITNFLQPRLKTSPILSSYRNMVALPAVDRLFHARERQESLVIFGDYDVDGVTSTALLIEVFKALGWQANFSLPHRVDEGYGLSRTA